MKADDDCGEMNEEDVSFFMSEEENTITFFFQEFYRQVQSFFTYACYDTNKSRVFSKEDVKIWKLLSGHLVLWVIRDFL